MNPERMYRMTRIPSSVKKADVILDTDAYNEIDDQFAIAYLLLSPQKLHTIALTAAPFLNSNSTSPKDGMEKSYREILHILDLMNRHDLDACVYRGSESYLPDGQTPVESDAADFLVEQARCHTPENPVYIIAIGAITNVASAILKDRNAMTQNAIVVWLGGHSFDYAHTAEFNLMQDVAAARILFESGIALTLVPCHGVSDALTTTEPELRQWLKGQNALADYLYEHTVKAMGEDVFTQVKSRVIWDAVAVAALLDRDRNRFVKSRMEYAPVVRDDLLYDKTPTENPIRYVYSIYRDAIFQDLFTKIREMGKEEAPKS